MWHNRANMRGLRHLILLLLIGFSLPTNANAAITIISKPIAGGPDAAPFAGIEGDPASNLNALTNPNGDSYWDSYTLGARLTAGEKITYFKVQITTSGPNGGLLQRWNGIDSDNPSTIWTPISNSISDGDTHLIAGSLIQTSIQENRTVKTSDSATTTPGFNTPHLGIRPFVATWGIGTSISGLWAYSSAEMAAQGSIVNFAYVVVPRFETSAFISGDSSNLQISVQYGFQFANGQAGPDSFLQVPFDNVEGLVSDKNLGSVAGGALINATLPVVANYTEATVWKLLSFTGPQGSISGASVDPVTGQFLWDTSNAPLGSYSAIIRGRSLWATDNGTLTFTIVPEPRDLALVFAALCAQCCCLGRKTR